MGARTGRGPYSITVPATTAPNSAVVNTAGCRFVGWSLGTGNQAGPSVEGSVTSPAAAAVIADFGTVPSGEYTLSWQVELGGTLAAGDSNNFNVSQAGVNIENAVCPAVAGNYLQEPIQIVIPAGGATLRIKATAAGTVGAIYSAQATLTGGTPAQATIFSGGEILGVTAPQIGAADTQIFDSDGLYVPTGQVKVTVLSGTISGCVYVRDDEDDSYWHPPGG